MEYKSTAKPRAMAGEIPVFCAYDELTDPVQVIGNPKNPNKHPKDQIALLGKIISGNGWRAPITVSRRSGFVVRGHGRLAAALACEMPQVPIDYQEYATEAEEWADLIADNRLSELSEIDNLTLADLISEMDTGEIPMEMSGYTEDDIASLLSAITGDSDDSSTGVDAETEKKEDINIPMSKAGDLWILGNHRLICGSATDPDTIERLMEGEQAQCVFTDPPYGVSYTGGIGKEWDMIKNDSATGDDLLAKLLIPAFKNMVKHTDNEAAFYVWHASSTRRDFEDAMCAVGLIEKRYIIWVKNNFQMGHADYHWGHEPCFYSEKAGQHAKFYGDRTNQTVWRATTKTNEGVSTAVTGGVVVTDGTGGKLYITDAPPKGKKIRYIRAGDGDVVSLYGEKKQSTAWEVSRATAIEHPTQKPVELATRAIENSTQEGDVVLDLFGGSGTTLIGAEMTHRRARLTELDPRYVDVIVNRYARITGNVTSVCVRDGVELPYVTLKKENDEANDRPEEMG